VSSVTGGGWREQCARPAGLVECAGGLQLRSC
jgi:hypothetical protein